jgi:hypothetical protein
MSIRFNPYAHWEGSGYAGPFETREAAEKFVEHALARGRDKARICSHSSMAMTSDNSPIVVNVTKRDVTSFAELAA